MVSEILEQSLLSAGISISTIHEEDILTDEEKEEARAWAIRQARDHMIWKMNDKGLSPGEIVKRISDINWDEEVDLNKVYANANSNKHYRLWEQEQEEKRKQEADRVQKELEKYWTAAAMFRLMKYNSQHLFDAEFIQDQNNMPVIKALCFFLSRDKRFETELGYSLKKGLWIRGVAGAGKTHLVKCVHNNGLNPVTCMSMIEITDEIKGSGEVEVPPFKVLYLDDVGTEETPVVYYGTKYNLFKDFIELYYAKNLMPSRLIISTNFSFHNVESKYGFRVRSRIKDMFNVIDMPGEDRRGN